MKQKRQAPIEPKTETPQPVSKKPGRFKRALRVAFPPLADWRAALPAFGLAILSGILIRFAYRPFNLSPLALVALVPLFWGLRKCRPPMAFWVGLCWAYTIGLIGTLWFVILDRFNPFIWLGIPFLPLYSGVYFGAATCAIVYLARRMSPTPALAAAMLAWAGAEWFMAQGPLGLPYGLAQSQGGWLSLAQIAAIGGMPMLSALIVGVNLSVMETLATIKAGYGHGGAITRLATMILLVIGGTLYGRSALSALEKRLAREDTIDFRVALLQPNISQELKFESYSTPDRSRRRELQDELTLRQLEQIRAIERHEYDLIVTSETTFTQDLLDTEEEIQRALFGGAIMKELIGLARDLDTPIVLGGVDNVFADVNGNPTENFREGLDDSLEEYRDGYRVYGGMWLLRPTDEGIRQSADYHKRQLMPFGETVPYLGIIPGFQEYIVQVGSFDVGELKYPIGMAVEREDGTSAEVKIGPSICFEDQFPYLNRHFARRGANLFVNITNDAWFDGSEGPVWHADMARWRSIESRLPMVRCTNSGVTMVVAAGGLVTEQLPPLEVGTLSTTLKIEPNPPKTIYTMLGDWFGILAFFGSIGLVLRERLFPRRD